MKTVCLLLMTACLIACATPPQPVQRNLESMQRELDSLSQQIKSAIGYPRCDTLSDCDAIATGYAPCGGPNNYQVYSRNLSSTRYLRDLANRRVRLQRDFNSAANLTGVCMIESKPLVSCRAGMCSKIAR